MTRCAPPLLRDPWVAGVGEHAKVSACSASSTRQNKNARPSTLGKTDDAARSGRFRIRILPLEGFRGSRTGAVSWLEAITLAFPEQYGSSGFVERITRCANAPASYSGGAAPASHRTS